FIADGAFPCVGAKAALARDALHIHVFGRLGARSNDAPLLDTLTALGRRLERQPEGDRTVHSCVAIFDGPADTSEARFEALLWAQLQRLHDLDVVRGNVWAGDVSRDPD